MRAIEKIEGLVIRDWYVSVRMETISTKKKGYERKEWRNKCSSLSRVFFSLQQHTTKLFGAGP